MRYQLSNTAAKDGWWVKISRAALPEKVAMTVMIYGVYGADRRLLRGPTTLTGGVITGKDGLPLEYTEIAGMWPGSGEGGKRTAYPADRVEVEITADRAAAFDVVTEGLTKAEFGARLSGNR